MRKGVLSLVLLTAVSSHAIKAAPTRAEQIQMLKQILDQIAPSASVGANYSNYSFNSTNGANYNRNNGESRSFSLGEFNHKLNKYVELGASVFGAYSTSDGRSQLNGAAPTGFSQSTTSLGISGNMTFRLHIKQPTFITTFVNYANNRTRTQSILNAGLGTEVSGRTSYSGFNLSGGVGLNTTFVKGRWIWMGATSYSFGGNYQESYTLNINGTNNNNRALTMTQHNFSESLQLRYQYKPHLSPFATLTLTQGVDRRYSRDVSSTTISSSVNAPKFLTSLYGAQVGGGLAIKYKEINITPSYRYQMQGKEFHSHNLALRVGMKMY